EDSVREQRRLISLGIQPNGLNNALVILGGDVDLLGTAELLVARDAFDSVAVIAGVKRSQGPRIVVLRFDFACEFQTSRWIGVQFTDSAPEGKELRCGNEVLVTVIKTSRQAGLAQHGGRCKPDFF